jgi:hypothetical protein
VMRLYRDESREEVKIVSRPFIHVADCIAGILRASLALTVR